jgi:hypothetical protein
MNRILICLIVFFCLFINISYAGQTSYLDGEVKEEFVCVNENGLSSPNDNILFIGDINVISEYHDLCSGYFLDPDDKVKDIARNRVYIFGSSISNEGHTSVLSLFAALSNTCEIRDNKIIIFNSNISIDSSGKRGSYGVYIGGGASNARVTGNEVLISRTNITNTGDNKEVCIVGGLVAEGANASTSASASAKYNEVSIFPGTEISNNSLICGACYIGQNEATCSLTKNKVSIYDIGEHVQLAGAIICGGYGNTRGDKISGNKLKVVMDGVFKAHSFENFETVELVLAGENAKVELEECQDLNGSTLKIALPLDAEVELGDSRDVVYNKGGSFTPAKIDAQKATGEFKSLLLVRKTKWNLELFNDEITATLLEDQITSRSESRSYQVSRAASVYSLAQVFNLSDIIETTYIGKYGKDDVVRGFHAFGTILGGKSKYNNIEKGLNLKGFGGLAGIGNKFEIFGETTTWGLVFDFGSRSYNVNSTDELSTWEVYAKGNVSNLGIRAFGEITLGEEHEKVSGMYIDGSIGIGNQKADYETYNIKSTIPIIKDQGIEYQNQFDFSVMYWGAHIGCGAKYPCFVAGKKLHLEIFGKYSLIHLGEGEVALPDNEVLTFFGTWLNCISLGLKGVYRLNPKIDELNLKIDVLSGIFLEQGIGKVKSESAGYPIKDLSLAGATLGVELGTKVNIKEMFRIDLVLQGSMISRIGYNVMLNLVYQFGKSISKETNYSKETYPEVS